jgi:hypothetical protein
MRRKGPEKGPRLKKRLVLVTMLHRMKGEFK